VRETKLGKGDPKLKEKRDLGKGWGKMKRENKKGKHKKLIKLAPFIVREGSAEGCTHPG